MDTLVVLQAPVKTRSGYGDHSREIARALIDSDKYTLYIIPTNWGNTPWTGLDTSTEIGKKIASCISPPPTNRIPDIFIQITIPNEFTKRGKYNIGITAGIETNLCKPEWIEGANNMDAIIGVSEHSLKVLKETAYDKVDERNNSVIGRLLLNPDIKLGTLFEGYDPNVFKKTKTISPSVREFMKSVVKEKFCFLFVGHWLNGDLGHDRKDVGMLIRTFCQVFKNKKSTNRPALVLKVSGNGFSIIDRKILQEKIDTILKDIPNPPSVYIVHGNLSAEELNSLYNHSKIKCMVSFTKGEGFGRPLLEFSTTGKPIIASDWSGQLDFLNREGVILLRGQLENIHPSAQNDWFIPDAKWFTVDYVYAGGALKGVFENYDTHLERAKLQQKYVEDNFTYEKMYEKFINFMEGLPIETTKILKLPQLLKK